MTMKKRLDDWFTETSRVGLLNRLRKAMSPVFPAYRKIFIYFSVTTLLGLVTGLGSWKERQEERLLLFMLQITQTSLKVVLRSAPLSYAIPVETLRALETAEQQLRSFMNSQKTLNKL